MTRTERYFIKHFGQATLRDAIEVAAQQLRQGLLPSQDFSEIPVNLNAIIEKRGINIVPNLPDDSPEDAILVPLKTGFILRLKSNKLDDTRVRFTIAHEIGHTFFYCEMKHQIGILNKIEIKKEEDICNEFAGALLMPTNYLFRLIPHISCEKPGAFLNSLENAANKFKVSPSALVSRIRVISNSINLPYFLLHLHKKEKRKTGSDKKLRVCAAVPFAKVNNFHIWNDDSAQNINLTSAERLFNKWVDLIDGQKDRIGGKYILDHPVGEIRRVTKFDTDWIPEEVIFTIKKEKWGQKKLLPILSFCCLYSKKWGDENQAYIISIIKIDESLIT